MKRGEFLLAPNRLKWTYLPEDVKHFEVSDPSRKLSEDWLIEPRQQMRYGLNEGVSR